MSSIIVGDRRAEVTYPIAGEHLVPTFREKTAPFAGGVEPLPPASGTVLGGMFSQIVSKWRKAFVKEQYLSPQLVEVTEPLLARAREIRRKVLKTFPTVRYLLEGE